MPIEMIGKKYSGIMSEDYQGIDNSSISMVIEPMVLFLHEIAAGEAAADYALGFCYYRTVFESPNRERKMKSMFGSQVDAIKSKDYDANDVLLAFKAYVFGVRNNQTPMAPPGWSINHLENIDLYRRLSAQGGSLIDYL
jgi:hypothetical protein